MGSRGGLRRLLLSRTRRASRSLHGLSPGDLGPGWAERLPRGDPLRACLRGGSLRPEEWRQVYSAADIVFSLTGSGGKRLPAEEDYQVSPGNFGLLAWRGFKMA